MSDDTIQNSYVYFHSQRNSFTNIIMLTKAGGFFSSTSSEKLIINFYLIKISMIVFLYSANGLERGLRHALLVKKKVFNY